MSGPRDGRIGRYEVLAEMGRGAMGAVYKARDPQLDRIVAIKSVRADLGLEPEAQAEFTRRFYQEARAVGRLSHPGIVAVHDVLEADGIPYLVMEYVEGRTLAQLLAGGRSLPAGQAVELVIQVCGALEYAHARGIVHRDIKPANILVTEGGEAKLADFGIAKVAGSKMTQTGALLGSPAYMSPEQVRGQPVDGRSDLFSLGVVLYQALTGHDPFPGDSPSSVLYKVAHVDPPPLLQANPAVPTALEAVLRRVLAKEPDERYPDAGAFAHALRNALDGPGTASARAGEATLLVTPPPARPRRGTAIIAAVAGVALLAGIGWLWGRGSGGPAPEPREEVARPAKKAAAAGPGRKGGGAVPSGPAKAAGAAPAREAPPRDPPAPAAPRPLTPAPARKAAGPPVPPPGDAPIAVSRLPGQATPRQGSGLGAILVVTNPEVEVFLDGVARGRAGDHPLLLADIPAGEHVVTLRHGAFEQRFRHTVRDGESQVLRYRFPAQPR